MLPGGKIWRVRTLWCTVPNCHWIWSRVRGKTRSVRCSTASSIPTSRAFWSSSFPTQQKPVSCTHFSQWLHIVILVLDQTIEWWMQAILLYSGRLVIKNDNTKWFCIIVLYFILLRLSFIFSYSSRETIQQYIYDDRFLLTSLTSRYHSCWQKHDRNTDGSQFTLILTQSLALNISSSIYCI